MSAEVDRFRLAVVQTLNRLAAIEERLQAEADARGIELLEAIHEHGAGCLREAAKAIGRLGRE